MRGSIIIILFFVVGVFCSFYKLFPTWILDSDLSLYALWALMFCVGISVGADTKALTNIRYIRKGYIILPLITIIGTLLGSALVSPFLPKYTLSECMAVGSGFGYYSLSSIFITQYKGAELGTIALISNIIREITTLLFTPVLVYSFGKLAPISCGGATTMDTTLPIISRYSGKEFAVVAIFHGVTVDLTVPFLVTFFATR